MHRSRLRHGLGATFAGLALVMVLLGVGYRTPVPLLVAGAFGLTALLIHPHGTVARRWLDGRLGDGRRERRGRRARPPHGGQDGDRGAPSTSRGTRWGARTGRGPDRTAGTASGRRGGTARSSGRQSSRSLAAARRTLGVDADADAEELRRAFRERVKDVHPDAPDGDRRRFERVVEAYERLVEAPDRDRP